MNPKQMVIIAGPNGAGKSTVAEFLRSAGTIANFSNADVIASGMSAERGSADEITAGRILLQRLHDAIERGESFSFETTLSGRIWQKFIRSAKRSGYLVTVCFVVVGTPEVAIERIKIRVAEGGHWIEDAVVRRRFVRSKALFYSLYRKLCDRWYVFDNSSDTARLIARKENGSEEILDRSAFNEHFRS